MADVENRRFTISPWELTIVALIGLAAGLTGGLLGVGGSVVIIPALTELLGPDQHRYQAAAMIVNLFVVLPAIREHRKAGAINRCTVARLVPAALVSVVVGVVISELPVFSSEGEVYLRGMFGLFLLTMSAYEFRRLFAKAWRNRTGGATDFTPSGHADVEVVEADTGTISPGQAVQVAVPTGFLAGLLGIGGGLIAVPLQRRLLHLPIRVAIANSAALIASTSCVGSLVKNYAYAVEHGSAWDSILLAVVLIPTAILGSMNGSRLTHVIPVRFLKGAFLLLLAFGGARQTWSAADAMLDFF